MLAFLRLDFTWPRPFQPKINETTSPVPHVPGRIIRHISGFFLERLARFSILYYCRCFVFPCHGQICSLPFGLVTKRSNRASIEKVATMKMSRTAGMRVPLALALACGGHAQRHGLHDVLIPLTRLPGFHITNYREPLLPQDHNSRFLHRVLIIGPGPSNKAIPFCR